MSGNHAYIQTRQALLDQLADAAASGMEIIRKARRYSSLAGLADACLEAIDFLLNYAADTEKTNNQEQLRTLYELSSGNSATMEQLRKTYMYSDKVVSSHDKGRLLDLTVAMEKIIWLIHRLIRLRQPENEQTG